MKKKINLKFLFLLLEIIIIITIFLILFLKYNKSKYSNVTLKTIKNYEIYSEIKTSPYSKTIEEIVNNNLFNPNYYQEYYKIDYTNIPTFSNIVNSFLEKNYKGLEINYILKNFLPNLDILLNMEKHIDILKYKDIPNFDITKIERYLNFETENPNYNIKTIVTYVNIGLDSPVYTNYETISSSKINDYNILVNKYHKIPDNYEPTDLVTIQSTGYRLRKEAAIAYESLINAAILDNVFLHPFSAYRSYEAQTNLYNNYKARDGESKADTYSARPGHSEHQLGLAIDIRSASLTDNLTPQDYDWLLNNSYKYGFIIRYPKDKQNITQFIEEPWHLRYLGTELATKVYNSNLTYDEYYDLNLKKLAN